MSTITSIESAIQSGVQSASAAAISPEAAKILLVRNTKNRNLSRRTVERFARSMSQGRWVDSVAAVSFDTEGVLSNGQHTLSAIVKSDTTQVVTLITGLAPESRAVYDTGNKRTLGGTLQMEGVANSNNIASASVLCRRYQEVTTGKPATLSNLNGMMSSAGAYDNIEMAAWATDRLDILHAGHSTGAKVYKATGRNIKPSAIDSFFSLAYMNSETDQSVLEDFTDSLIEGVNLQAGSAVLVLRNWALNADRKKDTATRQLATIAKAWAKYQAGAPVQSLTVRLDEIIYPV